MRFSILLVALLALPSGAFASACLTFVENWPGKVQLVSLDGFALAAKGAAPTTISYVSHSTFRIETPEDVVIATDYFGANGEGRLPDVVTMNHAHATHYTDYPDKRIPHVLRGWKEGGKAEHYLALRDVLVRNIPTDLRSFGFEADGNSIFVFEIGELCIGHLGHLHHEPSEQHYAEIGRLDVVMAPVDGTYTLNLQQMVRVLKRFKSRIVLPMHAFSPSGLQRFLIGMEDEFDIRIEASNSIQVSEDTLPTKPTVIVLPSGFITTPYDEFLTLKQLQMIHL
ncbi:MAG: MBL fold metallo-hydrolase [Pseudomonadota bacterium]